MSSGGQRGLSECEHGHYQRYDDVCLKCRVKELEREIATLRAERDAAVADLERLRNAVRRHRDMPGDDKCWADDEWLYGELPDGYVARTALDPETMLANCKRYIECRIKGLPYQTEQERIDAAVAAEMERCIRVMTALCRETNLEGEDAGEEIADAIRRGE